MSRRTAIVEEFDDDTELPLPSHPLPNTANGPLLEEIGDYSDDDEPGGPQPRASPSQPQFRPAPPPPPGSSDGPATVTSLEPYKKWTCIYPIYIDAKRRYGTGERRIERSKSVWWPLSKDIAAATNRLGLGTLHEVSKTHPRDWDNPGRVRVQWKKDGRFVNPSIQTKKQLLEMVGMQIQSLKADNVPKRPYTLSQPRPTTTPVVTAPPKGKGKQGGGAAVKTARPNPASSRASGRRLAVPPEPHPPLATRVSAYSPAISTGVLIETVKAGMNAQESAGGMPGAGGGGGGSGAGGVGGGQKGKRKMVRVRA